MNTKESWCNSNYTAHKVFEFFNVPYTVRDHHGMKIYEGEYGGKALWLMTTARDTELGVQFRALDTGRDMGGAFLRSCREVEFISEMQTTTTPSGTITEESKHVLILSNGGTVGVSRDGVHAEIN